jgi:putative membrane protein insertion efficiency factor
MLAVKKILSWPLVVLIRGYQLIARPWMPKMCRYTPSCSQYGIEALQKYGPFKGLWLTVRRIGRCHPWGGHGYDPVP